MSSQYIAGSNVYDEDHLLNVAHIVDLTVKRGGINVRGNSHKDDEAYLYVLLAEMSNGRIHELSSWDEKGEALLARGVLLKEMDAGFKVLSVEQNDEFPNRYISSVNIELQYGVQRVSDSADAIARAVVE